MIDPKSQEIRPASSEVYSDILELADELPDSSPRFILLSYPITLVRYPFLRAQAFGAFLFNILSQKNYLPVDAQLTGRRRDPDVCRYHMFFSTTYPRTATRLCG